MNRDQIVFGGVLAVLCLSGLVKTQWFLSQTRKGQWLVRKFGPAWAARVWMLLCGLGLLLGILLALDIVRPIRW